MKERLRAMIREAEKLCDQRKQCEGCVGFSEGCECVDRLITEYLIENGVIVSPCKIGDAVWFLNTHSSIAMKKNAVYEAKVVRIYVEKDNILCLSIQVKNEWGTTEFPRITEIGKTVFTTKEEAEKALAEQNDGGTKNVNGN